MISIEVARQQTKDILDMVDMDNSIVVMTTPFKLAVLNTHLVGYITAIEKYEKPSEYLSTLRGIHTDVQKVVRQILQQAFPQS